MKLTVISGAARPRAKSNTALILEAFCRGYEAGGNQTEVFFLFDRGQWEAARAAFDASDNLLIALPLYVENLPGLLLEFLTTLTPKRKPGAKLAFLVQGGFPEASQLRCCEAYLETLPARLGCEYGGTLIKGNMFFLRLSSPKEQQEELKLFETMGRRFAQLGRFDKDEVTFFAAPEYLPEAAMKMFRGPGKFLQRLVMNRMSRKMGGKGHLMARPYESGK